MKNPHALRVLVTAPMTPIWKIIKHNARCAIMDGGLGRASPVDLKDRCDTERIYFFIETGGW